MDDFGANICRISESNTLCFPTDIEGFCHDVVPILLLNLKANLIQDHLGPFFHPGN